MMCLNSVLVCLCNVCVCVCVCMCVCVVGYQEQNTAVSSGEPGGRR